MKNILKLLLLFLLSNIVLNTNAQRDKILQLPEQFSRFMPELLADSIYQAKKAINLNVAKKGTILSETKYTKWTVFSDRADNKLLDDNFKPKLDSEKKFITLDFLEKCYVYDTKDTYLYIISKSGKKEGWISTKNLIISEYAAIKTKTGVTKKAMVLTSVSKLTPSEVDKFKENLEKYDFYNTPNLKNPNGIKAKKFEIFYILKSEGNYSLLSRVDKLNSEMSSRVLTTSVVGWFLTANLTEWNHRVCYELQYGADYQELYKDKIIPVFVEDLGVEKIKKYRLYRDDVQVTKDIITKQTIPSEKLHSGIMRMPLLKHEGEPGVDIQLVAQILNLDSNADLEQNKAELKEKLMKLQKKTQSLNIFFVIDATSSMKPYFQAVAKSIEEIIKLPDNADVGKYVQQTRFGYALYRDYPDGKLAFEVEKLVGASQVKTLTQKLKNTTSKSIGKSISEAQYQGLIEGISAAGFNKDQSNIIVLIGDVGNHRDDKKYTLNQVIESLVKYETGLIAFQVINGTHPSYMDFNFDVQDYLFRTATHKHYDIDKKVVTLKSVTDEKGVQNTYMLNYSDDVEAGDYRMFGRFSYAPVNKMMNTSVLENNIKNTVLEYLHGVDSRIIKLEKYIQGEYTESDYENADKAFFEWLKRRNFDEKQISLLLNLSEVSSRGYTSKDLYQLSKPAYFPVVFLSLTEYNEIKRNLRSVNFTITHSGAKEALKNSMTSLASTIVGISEAEAGNLTMDEVWEIILGIPYNNNDLKDIKLKNLTSDIENDKFEAFFDKFRTVAKNFREKDFSKYSFPNAGQVYFWIPLEDLIGQEF